MVRLRAVVVVPVVVATAAAAAFGLYWFEPWRLVTDTEVREALPSVAATGSPGPAATGNHLLATGTFVSHEHGTSGGVRAVRLADGRRQLLLVGLRTSDGPDLRVWLTDRPVLPGVAGWRVFDDGRRLELGPLKGNRGDQVYPIPESADLGALTSVTIWCRRFAVSFGAAALTPTGVG
ncbi:hypothetical protein GCM10010123_41390 [Pilimelia anulata]|uniref:DM13 domain-containing protein n=1 Tax=Pilimelia anulata TaxID=53371 RepID=A0A8J3BGC5_9ACTN|nr:DM13 domain-containing protein [Pilimelia anulata]GGK07265.1 hypothetical protein GCM10010123_41390 [Pilimelia anulata]